MPDKYRSGCSQPSIGLSIGSSMKELEKGPKGLKHFPSLKEEQQYELTSIPRAPRDYTTNQRVQMEQPMAPAAYVAEEGLVGHQWEERPLVL